MSEIIPEVVLTKNRRQVLKIVINAVPTDEQSVVVSYADGYEEAGEFVQVSVGNKTLYGAELGAVLANYPTLYADLKEIAYAL